MFNIEVAISEWRRQMAAEGIKRPEVLNELECHLRDEVHSQARAGATEEQAFRVALRQLGQIGLLKREFEKSVKFRTGESIRHYLDLIATSAALALLFFGGLWYWLALRAFLAIASAVPGTAGLKPDGLRVSLRIFCTGLALLLASALAGALTANRTPNRIAL